ncbi:hypothetical protein AB0451_03220 [Streptomyces sp. NPDC052000]|uniref:hypothetical protein n=1 Tax=Streptomyces sp. NPDC052000 TaxID=3155676 RepID=UPI00345033B2
MGLFTPKYPKSDTPGGDPQPQRRESRADRKQREYRERVDTQLADDFKRAERDSKARGAHFWERYEKDNGPGSVDW